MKKIIYITGIIVFILSSFFILNPFYFIPDHNSKIKSFINENSPYSIEFDSFDGNFLKGFKVHNMKVFSEENLLSELNNIKFHPNFTSFFFNQINFGKVELDSGIVNLDFMKKNKTRNSGNNSIFKIDINNLFINNLTMINEGKEYNVQSKISLSHDDILKINIYDCLLSANIWPYQLELKNGNVSYNENRLILNNIDVTSKAGLLTINGNYDLKDIFKSFGNIKLNSLDISEITGKRTYFEQFSFMMERISTDSSLINLIGKMEYDTINVEKMECSIGLKKDYLTMNECSLNLLNGYTFVSGNYDLDHHLFDLNLLLNDIVPVNLSEETVINGHSKIEGTFVQDSIQLTLDFVESTLYGIPINSTTAQLLYQNNQLINRSPLIVKNDEINLISDKILSVPKDKSISMDIKFILENCQLSPTYIAAIDTITLNGQGDFNIDYSDGYLGFNGQASLGKIDYFNFLVDSLMGNFNGNLSFESEDNLVNSVNYTFDGRLKNITSQMKIPINIKSMDVALTGEGNEININKLNYFIDSENNGQTNWVNIDKDRIELNTFSILQNGVHYNADSFEADRHENWWNINNQFLFIENDSLFLNGRVKDNKNFEFELASPNIEFSIINSILGIPQRLLGNFKGSLNISTNDNIISFASDFTLSGGYLDDIRYDTFTGKFHYSDHLIDLEKLVLKDSTAQLEIHGKILSEKTDRNSIQNGDMDIFVNSKEMLLKPFNRYIPISTEIDGKYTGVIHLTGTPFSPVIDFEGTISNPEFDILSGRILSGEMTYSNEIASFNNLYLETDAGSYYGEGLVPINFSYYNKNSDYYSNHVMDFKISGKSTEFEFFTPYFEIIDSLHGNFNFNLELTGSHKNPIRNGTVSVNQGKLNLLPLENSIYGINGNVDIKDNYLEIISFFARTGSNNRNGFFSKIEKTINAFINPDRTENKNLITIDGGMDLTEFFDPGFNIVLNADRMQLTSSENIFNGYGKTELFVNGNDTIFVSGKFEPAPNDFAVLMEFNEEDDLSPEKVNAGKIIDYNIHIPLDNGVRINNSQMDGLIDGDIGLTATGIDPFIFSGNINVVDGSFYFNGNTIDQITGNILLDPGDNDPIINFTGITNVAGNDIEISLNGEIGNPNLSLISISDPNLNQNDLLYLLVFTPDTLQGGNAVLGTSQVGNLFTNYVENTLERNIVRNSLLDKFQFNTDGGTLLTGFENSHMNLYVGKNLSPNLYLNLRSDLNSNSSTFEYEVGYRISRNMSIIGKIDDNQLYHLTYRFKYNY